MILLWSGAIVNIPSGFVICDGNNDTPDLRNQFVIGAGDSYAVDGSGGNLTHSHTIDSSGTAAPGEGPNVYDSPTDTANHLPPYYALAYIMKT